MATDWEVLLPMRIDPSGPESIADFARCTGMDEYGSYEAALDDIDRYDAVIVRVAPLGADVIDRADRLQVIAKHGSGLDNVDVPAASRRDIVVCNTPGANARSVAEHAIALLFGVRRNLHTADRHVRAGNWERAAFTGDELTRDTFGVYGFGNIGRKTADLATGLGMTVLAFDPKKPDDAFLEGVERVESLEALFERSNTVSAHVPLTDRTRHSVSTAELAALGETGVLINTSRGAVVEETALHEALESGTVAGAGLDTFETEPPGDDHPLYARDEVLLTPHVGGVTEQALSRMSQQAAANVRTVYDGGLPDSTKNRADLSREVAG
ncbi:hydroxyacid dehydrogenase [Halosolutus halophilus]|uniref:hydroxyacid dehydrogenase n=1 Tax=Halosolutus halophilus TaxID=1552990 RepID=UPI0022350A95|nr:hydroxyacid dehydrogenase [Halosolutus halophilus]